MKEKSSAVAGGQKLPILDQPPAERADAARNREVLLCAAQRIAGEDGVNAVTMDRVAEEAGVGIGTVYRRFGDRSGLALALLDERERQFQESYLSGPPPLGPGAPPAERLRAFMKEQVGRLETDADLHALAERSRPTARFSSGAAQAARLYLVTLLEAAEVKGEVVYLADVLLAVSSAGLFIHQRRERGLSLAQIEAGLDQLLSAILPDPESLSGSEI